MIENIDLSKVTKSHIRPLDFEVIKLALTGDVISMNKIIDHYNPYLRELATKKTIDNYGNECRYMDESIRCQLENKLIKSVLKFKIQV
jgi:phosphatidate phosphatase PAH1